MEDVVLLAVYLLVKRVGNDDKTIAGRRWQQLWRRVYDGTEQK